MGFVIPKGQSSRRLLEAYWTGTLTVDEEREIEDAMPKETIAAFKPLVIPCDHPSEVL